MNKGEKSVLNAITALMQMAAISLIGLVLTRTIIGKFGSDYNGINSTVNQIVNAIMVLEGGFTLASNVALFGPFSKKDYSEVNGIVSATKKRFQLVGIIALLVGCILSVIYPFFVTGSMPIWMISAIMITVLVPSCFNLGIVMKYRVLILADQSEYIISIITTACYVIGCIAAIIIMEKGGSLLIARIIIMLFLFANYILIMVYCKHKYPWVSFREAPLFEKIKGTKSVMVMKITSMIYMSFPVIVISTLPENGAMMASVYAVYRSVTTVVGGALGSFSNAPRLGFGALFAENRKNDAEVLFHQYEKITCFILSLVLGTTCLMLIPFVELYTKGVSDIEYINKPMAVIMLLTVFLETIHIPSGQIMQMSGEFDPYRKIQLISCIALIGMMIIGRIRHGIFGIIGAVLGTAIIIALMEMSYTRKNIFTRRLRDTMSNVLPCLAICIIMTVIGFTGVVNSRTYPMFFLQCVVGFLIAFIASTILFCLADFTGMKEMVVRVRRTLQIRKNAQGSNQL